MVWRNSIVPSSIRASSLSLFASFTYLAGAFVSVILGAILDASNQSLAFAFSAVIGLTAIPLFLKAKSKKYEREAPAAPPKADSAQQM
jgi:uncharacterized membrane protein YfcA